MIFYPKNTKWIYFQHTMNSVVKLELSAGGGEEIVDAPAQLVSHLSIADNWSFDKYKYK